MTIIIDEIIIYKEQPTKKDMARVEEYLNTKYGKTIKWEKFKKWLKSLFKERLSK